MLACALLASALGQLAACLEEFHTQIVTHMHPDGGGHDTAVASSEVRRSPAAYPMLHVRILPAFLWNALVSLSSSCDVNL